MVKVTTYRTHTPMEEGGLSSPPPSSTGAGGAITFRVPMKYQSERENIYFNSNDQYRLACYLNVERKKWRSQIEKKDSDGDWVFHDLPPKASYDLGELEQAEKDFALWLTLE